MSLIKTKGNGNMSTSLRQDLDELFDIDHLLNDPIFRIQSAVRPDLFNRMPATNIMEDEKEFIVEVAAPGMEKNDFHVDVQDGCLAINVEKEKSKEKKEKNYTRREYNYNSFHRSFNLPQSVEAEKINAEYKNGILQIHLPKSKSEIKNQSKEIQIK